MVTGMTTTTSAAPAVDPGQQSATPPATASAPSGTPAPAAFSASSSTPAPAPSAIEAAGADSGEVEIALPESFHVEPEVLTGFKSTAKELGLDSPKAQKLFDQYVALETKRAEAATKAFEERNMKWVAEIDADKEIGGAKKPAALASLRKAINHLGGEDVAKAIVAAGLGNHPALVRGLVKLGRGLGEDSVSGTTPAAGDKGAEVSLRDVMYPTMRKSKP
jgi:hypothetical protein